MSIVRPSPPTLKILFSPRRVMVLSLNVSSLRDWTPVCTAFPWRIVSFTAARRAAAPYGEAGPPSLGYGEAGANKCECRKVLNRFANLATDESVRRRTLGVRNGAGVALRLNQAPAQKRCEDAPHSVKGAWLPRSFTLQSTLCENLCQAT